MHVAKVLTTGITGLALAFSMLASALPADAAVGYHAAYFSESDFLARSPGQTGQFGVGYTNTGDRAWVKGAAGQQANLATAAPLDNTTDFAAGWSNGWLSANRYAAQDLAIVGPGQIAFFIYNFTVPASAAAGEHRFYGREVVDGVTWMEDYGYYQSVTVTAPSAAPVLNSLTPNTGTNAGGTSVTIDGTGFVCSPTLPTVNFGTAAATVTSCGATSLVVTSPAGAVGTASVTVANAGGATSNGLGFIYTDLTKPVFNSVTASGNAVILVFSEPVCRKTGAGNVLATGWGPPFGFADYTITTNGNTVATTSETLPTCDATASNGVTSYTVTTDTVFVTGDTVVVTLNSIGAPKLQDAAGNTPNPQTRTASSVTPDTTKPSIATAVAQNATTIKLTYSEAVTCNNAVASAAQFVATATGGAPSTGATISCTALPAGSTTVTVTFGAPAFASGVGGSLTYTAGAAPVRISDRVGNEAVTPQTLAYTGFTTDTTRPLSQDIRIKTKTGSSSTLNTGDIFTVAFNEVMLAPANGSTISLIDADGTVGTVMCGTAVGTPVNSTATCALSTAAITIGAVSYPLGQVITVALYANPTIVTAGSAPGLQIPSTVFDSAGFTDAATNSWDVANSPDKILN